jgi:hypothetical protein
MFGEMLAGAPVLSKRKLPRESAYRWRRAVHAMQASNCEFKLRMLQKNAAMGHIAEDCD